VRENLGKGRRGGDRGEKSQAGRKQKYLCLSVTSYGKKKHWCQEKPRPELKERKATGVTGKGSAACGAGGC